MAKYLGHRSWAAWNVSLWINNEEWIYNYAVSCKRECKTLRAAVNRVMGAMGERTPDGARVTFTSVREALEALD